MSVIPCASVPTHSPALGGKNGWPLTKWTPGSEVRVTSEVSTVTRMPIPSVATTSKIWGALGPRLREFCGISGEEVCGDGFSASTVILFSFMNSTVWSNPPKHDDRGSSGRFPT